MIGPPAGVGVVRVLGPVQVVTSSGDIVDLPSVSQRRLLGLLALHARQSVRSGWLADALDVSPGSLRTTVARLRKVLGADALHTTALGYCLDMDVDADLFSRDIAEAATGNDRIVTLERALARWRGAVLDEFASEDWAAGEVARLTELHASATEDLAAAMIAASRRSDAVALIEPHIAVYPFRDRPRGLLMEALAGEGRQRDALRAFQQYRALLADEVGTEPSAELRRIEQRVATDWAPLDLDIPLHAALTHGAPLVGRSREWAWLNEDVAQAVSAGLRTIVLCGEAGIGKTTLLAAFARELHHRGGAAVLYARCDDGAAVPLQPFRSLIGWCVEQVPTQLLEAHAARCGGELQRVAPQLAGRVSVPEPARSDDATERFMLFEAVADMLRRIAGNDGLVLMLDDLHWAEPTALSLVRHLTRALADAPVLLIASSRDAGEHVSDELRLVLADLDRGGSRRISLSGLDDSELTDLVVSITEPAGDLTAVTARLRDDSAGNPLYATQLIRYWVETGRIDRDRDAFGVTTGSTDREIPPSLRDVVWSRVGVLGATASAVLSAASVLGVEFDDSVLVEVVDVDEEIVGEILDAAAAAGLLLPIEPVTRTMRFAHALVANALYAELQPVRRRQLHERAARALGKRDEVPQKIVVQLARHCALGGLLSDALRWATAAGDHAFAQLAPSEAATWYRVALGHCAMLERADAERADLVVRLGDALHRAGDPAGLGTLREGAELAERCGASSVLVRAALATDRGFFRVGTPASEQLAIVESAVSVADPDDVTTYARLLALFAQSLINTSRAGTREVVARQALDLATNSSDPSLLLKIASPVLYALWAPGASPLRAEVAARAVAAAETSHDPVLEFATHIAVYTVAIELADPVAASRSLARLRAIAAQVGEPRMRWTVGIYETFETMMAARLDDAERIAGETLDLGLQIGESDAFAIYAIEFFVIGTFAGRHADLFPVVEQAASGALAERTLKISYAIICAAVGRDDTAREILAEGVDAGFSNLPRDMLWMTSVIGYAVLAIELQDEDAAAQLFPIIEPFASEVAFTGATSQGPIAAYLGKLASLLGHHDLADAYLREALDTAIAFGWEYHRATTLIALAQSRLRRTGALDAEAQGWLSAADGICTTRGLRSWATQIESLRGPRHEPGQGR